MAENNSAIPQDRIGFNFNSLNVGFNGTYIVNTVEDDFSEYRFFAEKTLFGSNLSVDVMIPFYQSSNVNVLYADYLANGPGTDASFGDLAFGFKYLVHRNERSALSAGMRIEAPTNEEFSLTGDPVNGNVRVEDSVWHFTPYLAGLLTPTERTFYQSFVSYRMPTGSVIQTKSMSRRTEITREQDYFMFDLSAGYWLYNNPGQRGLTGLAPTLELHYTATFDDQQSNNRLTNRAYSNTDVLNLTAGLTAMFNDRISVSTAVAAPLRDKVIGSGLAFNPNSDRRYDWALMFQLNYYLGR
ncbi:hypothetical protein NHH03_13065 [Stieleria sp. TO1_6]|uniref:hypothetical protein n=1 Tax=Stieleria tagensis TaxID=2956795 RepID=UPI00209ABBAF|nr:hypothetical protein [Stieleria tagensis]MCO8122671.1 hypothetical protein [Stieleria tagensis]